MISKRILFFLLILILIVPAQKEFNFGWYDHEISVDGQNRFFKIYIPRGINNTAPAVLLFHPENKSMNNLFDAESGGFAECPNLADREKIILIIPNGINPITGDADGNNQKWNDCRKDSESQSTLSTANDIEFIDALIDWSKQNLQVDKNRIYAAGVSNGGLMVYRTAIELGDKIAAAAVFLANLPYNSECKPPVRPIPIFIMNATGDPIMPFEGGTIVGERGDVMSAEQTLNFWISLNYLNTQKRTNQYLRDREPDDNSRIILNEFNRPLENPPVSFYVIADAGHVVPSKKYTIPKTLSQNLLGNQNRDIEGVVTAWKFLREFSLP